MATTTNYSWTTPDDTALVKDGAAAIRTLGSSVDTTVKALNPGTTAGDIDYYTSSTAKSRVAIGSAGQVLTVAGGVPAWGSVPAVNDTFTLLNAGGTSLTGATTITVSGISNKNKLHVEIQGASAGSASSLSIRLNSDSGSNYSQRGMFFIGQSATTIAFNNMNTTAAQVTLAKMGTDTADTISGTIDIQGTATSGVKPYQLQASATDSYLASNSRGYVAGGAYLGTSSITSISIISSSGNFDAGSIWVYGA